MDNALTPISLDSSSRLIYNTNYKLEYKSGKLQVMDSDGVVPPNGSIAVTGAKSPFTLTADASGIKFGGVMIAPLTMAPKSAFVDCRVSINMSGVVLVYAQFKYTEDIKLPSLRGVSSTIKKGTLYNRQLFLVNPSPPLGALITSFSALGPGKLLPVPGAGQVLATTGGYSLVSSSTGVVVKRTSDGTIGWRATCKYIYIDPSGNLWFTSTKYSLPTQMVNWGKPQTGTASSAKFTLDTNGKLNLRVGNPVVYQSTLEPVQDCVVTWGPCTSGKQTATITKNPTGFGAKQCPAVLTQNCNDCVDATPSPGMCINGKNDIKYSGFKAASADSTKKTCKNNDTVKNQTCTEGLDGVDDTIETYTALVATIKAMGPASSSLVSNVDAAWTKLRATQSLSDQTKFVTAVKAFISGFKGTLPPDTPGRVQLMNMQLNTAADLAGFLGAMNAYKSIGASSGGSQGLGAASGGSQGLGDFSDGSQDIFMGQDSVEWGECIGGVKKKTFTNSYGTHEATRSCGDTSTMEETFSIGGNFGGSQNPRRVRGECIGGFRKITFTHSDGTTNEFNKPCGTTSGGSQITPINCVGAWSDCVNGSQTYTVTTPASGGGAACPAVDGATKTCGTPCEGTWSAFAACSNGKQTQVYNVTKQPTGGGKECPLTNTRDCGTACVGNWTPWGACDPTTGKQSRTYLVATQASGGGLACPSPLTESQSCAIDCVGAWDSDWSECVDGSQTKMYTITTEAFSGGQACSDKDGDKKTQSCKSEAPEEVVETPIEFVEESSGTNIWLYVGGGVLLLIVLVVAFMMLRKKK